VQKRSCPRGHSWAAGTGLLVATVLGLGSIGGGGGASGQLSGQGRADAGPGEGLRGADAPVISGCQVFPNDNLWNTDISAYPVDPNSADYIASINSTKQYLHPDFGSDPTYGIPFVVVPGTQAFVPITFTDFGDESDPGPYPIPANAPVESGSDRHVLVLDFGNCHLYELYNASKDSGDSGWTASSGAVFDLVSDQLRPDGWTSADAAGLPILPGLVRYDEVTSGVITHALRFTVHTTERGYIHPATHYASSTTDPTVPPMGLRLRLKASYDVSHVTGESLVILTALKKYGMMVADNGSSWYISGSTDMRWNDDDLNQVKSVPGSAFEVVKTGSILPTPPTLPKPAHRILNFNSIFFFRVR
jgi:hypothetical protein